MFSCLGLLSRTSAGLFTFYIIFATLCALEYYVVRNWGSVIVGEQMYMTTNRRNQRARLALAIFPRWLGWGPIVHYSTTKILPRPEHQFLNNPTTDIMVDCLLLLLLKIHLHVTTDSNRLVEVCFLPHSHSHCPSLLFQ